MGRLGQRAASEGARPGLTQRTHSPLHGCHSSHGSACGVCACVLQVLEGHHGMAKGVAWDPIGRYIASQGDDRAVLVWESREWSLAGARCW